MNIKACIAHKFVTTNKAMLTKLIRPIAIRVIHPLRRYTAGMDNSLGTEMFRFNYSENTENQINIQIGRELQASQMYLAMSAYFARTNVALNGSSGFFLAMSDEERAHSLQLIKYQILRGGNVWMCDMPKPERQEWENLMDAFTYALQMETNNTESLMTLYKTGEEEKDFMLMDFISSKYLQDQLKDIRLLGTIITRLKHADKDGQLRMDRELEKKFPYTGGTHIV